MFYISQQFVIDMKEADLCSVRNRGAESSRVRQIPTKVARNMPAAPHLFSAITDINHSEDTTSNEIREPVLAGFNGLDGTRSVQQQRATVARIPRAVLDVLLPPQDEFDPRLSDAQGAHESMTTSRA